MCSILSRRTAKLTLSVAQPLLAVRPDLLVGCGIGRSACAAKIASEMHHYPQADPLYSCDKIDIRLLQVNFAEPDSVEAGLVPTKFRRREWPSGANNETEGSLA